jgi:type II secretory pathway pseudopilin PulG
MVKSRAFTLIELLLVTFILAAMVAAGLGMHRVRSLQVKIEKTALQTQQWLQGAQLYYVKHGQWPSTETQQVLLDKYLPQGSQRNAWGLAYQIAEANADDKLRFRLLVPVPATPRNQTSDTAVIGERLAALLPNAKALHDNFVSVEITAPGQSFTGNTGVKIIAIEQRQLHGGITAHASARPIRVAKPSIAQCPTDVGIAKLYLSLTGYDFNRGNQDKKTHFISHTSIHVVSEDEHAWYVDLVTYGHLNPNYANHNGEILIIKTCEQSPGKLNPPILEERLHVF